MSVYEYVKPSAPGDLTEIESQTPDSGEHWDKLLTKDGDTTKIHTINATWQNDLYLIDITDLPSGIERCSFDYVRVYLYTRFIAPCPPWPEEPRAEGIFKTHGIVYPSGNWFQPMATYTDIGRSSTTNPHTGEAWTWDEIENLQIGVRLHCDGIYEVACSALQIRLYYTPVPAIVTTQAVTEIAGITATGNGAVVDFGGDYVFQHGHCWSTSPNPTTSDSKTDNGWKYTPGAFTSSMTGLIPGTKYYVRTYALTTQYDLSYGAEVEFTTPVAPRLVINKAYALSREEL